MGVFASAMLEEACVLPPSWLVLVVKVDSTGHMAFNLGLQYSKTHCDGGISGRDEMGSKER